MYYFYAGFLAAFYVALTFGAVLTLPTHPRPAWGALAFFVLVPGLIVGFTGEFLGCVSEASKAAVAEAINSRRISRKYAFGVGSVIGLIALAGIMSVYYTAPLWLKSKASVVTGFILIGAVLVLSPHSWVLLAGAQSKGTTPGLTTASSRAGG